jgi:shikimate kinase
MSSGPTGPPPHPEGALPRPRRIVLTGFMGAGKSTVGRLLASRLGWPFRDIDDVLTAEHRLTVAEIFSRHGEEHFRALEAEAIARTIEEDSVVIALGGGAIETEAVRSILFTNAADAAQKTLTIYLEAPLPELLARCSKPRDESRDEHGDESGAEPGDESSHERPLLAAPESLASRLARRLPHYERAHLTVRTSGSTPEAVIAKILAHLPQDMHQSDLRHHSTPHSSTSGAAS